MLVHQTSPLVMTIPGFLSPQECNELIDFSEMRGYDAADVSLPTGARMMKHVRNNDRLIYEDQALADRLWEKLAPHCPVEIDGAMAAGLNERFRFYRYTDAQRFKRHIDGRFRRNEVEESRLTFLIYLNDDYQGGQTKFDEVTVHPLAGTALCFLHEQKHESVPIDSGIKYVLRTDVMYRRDS